MNLKSCPLMGKECQYQDCAMWNKNASQCSISIIAEDLRSASVDTSAIADSLVEIGNEVSNITTALKGLA